MTTQYLLLTGSAALVAALPLVAMAQSPSSDEMNASNNPLTPSVALNLQDDYVGRYYGLGDEDGNSLLLRGAIPHKLFGLPQLMRATLPIVTTPHIGNQDSETGLGDLNVFDLFLMKSGQVEYGFGPQLTIPTASKDETGTGKWQAGLAAMAIAPQRWGLLGALVTWQAAFAGDSDREHQNNLQAQPFYIYNMPQGWYFRSTATWNFNLKTNDYYIPFGAGIGKVWKSGKTTLNLFAEPQWTVAHDGDGQPKFQVFMGLNLQFPL